MSYVAIADAIQTKLLTITDINIVYNHEPKELVEYPAATISARSHTNAFNDLCANVRRYVFIIRLYFRTDVAQDAETVLRDLADQVITIIEADPTIGGSCDFAIPTSGSWSFQTREVPVKVVEILVEARKRVERI